MYQATQFLIIEDNLHDAQVIEDFFKELKISNLLNVFNEGSPAMHFLHRQQEYASAVLPDIILISLNLLKDDNAKLLYEIKKDPTLQEIPVVVLTTTDGEETILGENAPINMSVTKPLSVNCISRIMHSIDDFWLTIVKQ